MAPPPVLPLARGASAAAPGDVRTLLARLGPGLDSYADALAREGFDSVPALDTLTEEDLRAMGMSLGHRKLLAGAIAARRRVPEAPAPAPSPAPAGTGAHPYAGASPPAPPPASTHEAPAFASAVGAASALSGIPGVSSLAEGELRVDPEPIGHGSFGVVYRATWRGTAVAVKVLSRGGSARSWRRCGRSSRPWRGSRGTGMSCPSWALACTPVPAQSSLTTASAGR